jgi:hypothetical protein
MATTTIVTPEKHVILFPVKVASCFGFVFLTVAAKWATECVQMVCFSFELLESGRD